MADIIKNHTLEQGDYALTDAWYEGLIELLAQTNRTDVLELQEKLRTHHEKGWQLFTEDRLNEEQQAV